MKLSIIVPVYNMVAGEKLEFCLNSLTNQTISDYEIIAVNDASTDDSLIVLNWYKNHYPEKFKVIDLPENRKQGGAKNAGLDVASGEYIGFVDSDDWCELDMFEYLITNAQEENADITVCRRFDEYPNRSVPMGWAKREVLNKETALYALLENKNLYNHVWDKLWKKELFQNVRFPVGRTFEDLAVAYRLFEQAERILCLPEVKHHYLQRPDSILGDVSLKNRINCYLAARQRYEDMHERYPQFCALLERACVAESVRIWACYWYNPSAERKRYHTQLNEIASFAQPRWKQTLKTTNMGILGRMVLCLLPYATWWSFGLAGLVGRVYKLRHGKLL